MRPRPEMSQAAMRAFDTWWRDITRQGDPDRRPRLTEDAFAAGYAAALGQPHPCAGEMDDPPADCPRCGATADQPCGEGR
jgi:hypothetical protein